MPLLGSARRYEDLIKLQNKRQHNLDQDYSFDKWGTLNKKVAQRAVTLHTDLQDTEKMHDTLESLLSWISDIDALMANQKPPSSEVKVVKAQLQEQKLLKRLLEERRPSIEVVLQSQHYSGRDEENQVQEVSELQDRWKSLLQKADQRFCFLEQILPAAQCFQESVDSFQEWLNVTEQHLAELRATYRNIEKAQETLESIKILCEEIKSRTGLLDDVQENGKKLQQLISDEEFQVTQERMDCLKVRYFIVSQNSAEMLEQLQYTLEASCRMDSSAEDLSLWLGRLERELALMKSDSGKGAQALNFTDNQKFEQVIETELTHLLKIEERLQGLTKICLNLDVISSQLYDQKILSLEILQHKGIVERLQHVGDVSLDFRPESSRETVKAKLDSLSERCQQVYLRNSTCIVQLEHAHSLLGQFAETEGELTVWLDESQVLIGQLSTQFVSHRELKEQQDILQEVREAVAEHKPLLSKLKSVSSRLTDLNSEEGVQYQDRCKSAEECYNHIKERLRESTTVLEEAIPRYTQLTERMDHLTECLEGLQEKFSKPCLIRGESARIQEQIHDNKLLSAELQKLGVALNTIRTQGTEFPSSCQTASGDPTAKAIQDKVNQLDQCWAKLCDQSQEREQWLVHLLNLAERFWHDLAELAVALTDTQQMVLDMDEAGSDPETIRQRLNAMQTLREDIDNLQSDLDTLGILGVELMSSCGDMEKPDVTRRLDELYAIWGHLNKVWSERCDRMEKDLQSAVAYQETMQGMFEWLNSAETRISQDFLVGVDLETVTQQLCDLKVFKREVYQQKIEMESLNLHRLHGVDEPEGAEPPLYIFRQRWDKLEEEVVSRQHQLESALLGLGQFQNTLDELLAWLSHTAELLQNSQQLSLDLQSCEIELAKHRVLRNDVMSHQQTVESLCRAGQDLLKSSANDNAEMLETSLKQLSEQWECVRSETERRQLELENNLSQVQDVTMEIQDLLQWLEQVDLRLSFSKQAWGPPDTAKERLTVHLELCEAMEAKLHMFNNLRDTIHRLLNNRDIPRGSNTEHSLCILEQKWEVVQAKLQERKRKLTEGLTLATEFHNTVQDLLKWMAQTEGNLAALPPPSLILETVNNQIQEHKVLVAEVKSYNEKLSALESESCQLKEFSREQDCTVILNLLVTVQDRWGKVFQSTTRRGQVLEEARKRAKQFSESRQLLLDWMDEAELNLENNKEIAVNHDEIKQQLVQHKEFQKFLRSKRPVYEATLKSGRSLREKAQILADSQQLGELIAELKDKWDTLCGKAMERQHKLEEALLFSGRFTDALQALMDWLYGIEPQMSEEMPIGGDRDLVNNLIDKHKDFQKELGKRAGCMKTLKRSVRDLTKGNTSADSQWLQEQMEELDNRWETVCSLSVSKQTRLEAALRQAEEFHSLVQSFLERLSESERTLKYGAIPEEESALLEFHKQHQEILKTLECQQMELECIASLGEEILSACHPDAVITIKSWLSITKTRFQEVQTWAQQQEDRTQAALSSLSAEREEVNRLIEWILAAEESLTLRNQEPFPDDMGQMEELIMQHKIFMEEVTHKQIEVEKATKSCKKKIVVEPQLPQTRRTSSKRRCTVKSQNTFPVPFEHLEPQNPHLCHLLSKWQQLWFLTLDRQSRLQDRLQRLCELQEFANFDFSIWRKRYMQWISHMKSRILDVFRGIDRDQDGRISQQEFIESVMSSKFPTNSLEMSAVANIFDLNGDGFIDYYEFVSALHPSRDTFRRNVDADKIQEEVNRQVAQCSCAKRFKVQQISANRYKFGDSQQLRMVRILRSTLMVRVGGGWIALDEFLVKNDPCRVKGRTNLKIKEKYLSSDTTGSSSAKYGSTKLASPSHSSSNLSLYSSVSAPTSPSSKKSLLRRSRSGDRSCRPQSSPVSDGVEFKFKAAEDCPTPAPTECKGESNT
ncbi:microtubule-actin cross-linking factor 1-like [Protopterus annectens]|uniref:microtubule-actin cross-linking factor 1-like n=1 Tax=Protopterus annectens TaxID=7888 RepID=UPI001CFB17EF|nr:microtubule-actin cross-linking factor 1-like [Protopterus annectens]